MAAIFVGVMAGWALYAFCTRPVYESTAMVTVVSTQPPMVGSGDLRVLSDLQGLTRGASAQSHIQLIGRPDVLATAAARMKPADIARGFGAGLIPKWAVRVGLADKDSDVVAVTARAYDAHIAADYANAVVTAYVERDQTYSRSATKQGRQYVLSELDAVQKQLAQAQRELSSYKQQVHIISPESQIAAITDSMVSLQSDLDKAIVDSASAQRQMQSQRRQLAAQGNEIQENRTIQVNPRYQSEIASLDALNARKASLAQDYSPKSKEMRKLDGEIAAAEQRLTRLAQTMVASTVRSRNPILSNYLSSLATAAAAQAKVRALQRVIASRQKKMQEIPGYQTQLATLTTRVSLLQGIYQDLSQKYYVLLVNENSTLPNARLASAAMPARRPSVPNRSRSAVVFFMLGIIASLGAAWTAERFDSRIRDDAAPSLIMGEEALAVIPPMESIGAFIESFRTLRNVISSRALDGDKKILAITSPGRDEGKRTICVNLAIAMAWSGKKVLLVDTDLRQPSLAAAMNVPGDVGLTNIICGLVTAEEAIHPTVVENVFCMPAGPVPYYPSQFLNSPASLSVLREVSQSFDLVIVNGPPCSGLSDIQIVAAASDAVVVVVMMDQTSRGALAETMQSLSRVKAPYVGYILNGVADGKRGEDYYLAAQQEVDAPAFEKPALLSGSPEE